MVNTEKLFAIAKPRNKKAHRKFMLRRRFRWLVTLWQNLQLLWHKL